MSKSRLNKQWQWREALQKSGGNVDEQYATLFFFIDGLCNRLRALGWTKANLAAAFKEAEEAARKEGGGR